MLAPLAPNPTRGAATVRWELPRDTDARVAVYGAWGREVVVVAEGAQGAAAHEATPWGLAPGAYVVRLTTASGGAESARLTVVR